MVTIDPEFPSDVGCLRRKSREMNPMIQTKVFITRIRPFTYHCCVELIVMRCQISDQIFGVFFSVDSFESDFSLFEKTILMYWLLSVSEFSLGPLLFFTNTNLLFFPKKGYFPKGIVKMS